MKKSIVFNLKVLLSIIIFFFNYTSKAQVPCKVLLENISSNYEGKCKKGLAHGKGHAKGIDQYEGSFKNGFPDGNGKYTWASGNIYEGHWKQGVREGEGKLIFKKDGVDSVKFGYWKEDKFVRKITPSPYRIIKSKDVSRYSFTKVRDGNRCLISFMLGGKPNTSLNINMYNVSSGTEYTLGNKKGFDNITFPFICRINYSYLNLLKTSVNEAIFEFEIREPGVWEVTINN